MPPIFCASAITCNVMVVLPEDSGPNTSTTRPRGNPPTPKAASNEIDPVGITEIGTMASFDPSRMIDPLPNCFSIWDTARSIALPRSSAMEWLLLKTADYECCLILAGLYIRFKANKRRIYIINLWKVPNWVNYARIGLRNLSGKRNEVPRNPVVKQDKAKFP